MRNGRDTFALGRRISKQVEYSGDWDCTYHYYYDGQRMIETRDVNNQVLKQHVWGLTYVDELVQIAINQDPENATTGTNTENLCERFFWALQDANFNVMAVVNSTGIVVERYEYTPYGQRTIFGRDWLATDADEDGTVNLGDWSKLAIEFEESGYEASTSDTTGDGIVNLSDQSQMSFDWGKCWAPAADPLASYPRLETTRGRRLRGWRPAARARRACRSSAARGWRPARRAAWAPGRSSDPARTSSPPRDAVRVRCRGRRRW